jgi:hypothetical protein
MLTALLHVSGLVNGLEKIMSVMAIADCLLL